ncbi:hypothetical protein Ddc_01677 [Ditylenchus destructor]|nr:hypothetical protein Ddc_01677 [Ditylenchus destructor]
MAGISVTSVIGVHALACFPTSSRSPPVLIGCPALVQTLTNSNFSDGVLTFTYDNPNFRTSVVANCSEPDATQNLFAGIVVNQNNFLDDGFRFVTFSGTCDTSTGQWMFGNPPLVVSTIECLLATGAGQIGG